MRLSGTKTNSIHQYRGLGNQLWDLGGAVPSLDLRFSESKNLVDAVTGQSLVTFTRASSGTYVGSDGLIKTATTNEPRFDHNPATGESLGLLVEEQRTNSISNNTMVGAVAGTPGTMPTTWTFSTNTGGAISRQVVGTGTEDGIPYIDLRVFGTTPSSGVPEALIAFASGGQIAAANGQTWTASTYVKAVAGSLSGINNGELFIIYNQADGITLASASSSTFSYSLTPTTLISTRRSYTLTASSALTAFVFARLDINFALNTAVDFTLRIGLPQLEQGAFATSVIPTSTTAVTRSADVASISGSNFSSWYRQDEGTVFWEGSRTRTTGFPERFNLSDGTANNRIFSYWDAGANSSTFNVTSGSVDQGSIFGGGSALLSTTRSAFGLATNNTVAVYSGTTQGTDTTVTLPTASQLTLGTSLTGTIRRLTYWPQRLSNSTLQTITR